MFIKKESVNLNLSSNVVADSNDENDEKKYYWLIHKFQSFVKLLKIILQLI